MVSSSFQVVPGLPILHSNDLQNWTIIGHALDRLPSPRYDTPQNGGGVWAPSIRFHQGFFWIYYGDPDLGVFMTKARDPRGPWDKPVLVREALGWIDPCPLWEPDGTAYLVHAWAKSRAGFNSILTVHRMSPDGTRVLDEGARVPQGASMPEPADRARQVDPGKVVLRWVPVRDAISHRLFFSESEPPMFREEMSRLQYEPGPLSPGTTYYWRVDELTRSGIIIGPVWSFTTATSSSSIAAGTAALPWSRCMNQPAKWYGTAEALRIGENVLFYQRKSGGWPKNIDMAVPLSDSGRARVEGEKGLNDSTIDNDSTTTQIRFLARVYESTGRQSLAAGILAGIRFLLAAQYPNGGWPQYYPLRGDYSRQITYNDDAMVHVMELLRDIAAAKAPFAFVDRATREQAAKAVEMAIQVTLAAQVTVNGKLTSWCAQHDARTLEPCGARAYELPSLSGRESVGITHFLMAIEKPSTGVVRAIEAAVEWFRASAIRGWRVDRKTDPSLPRGFDYVLVADPSAPPIWARFYDVATNRPMFVGRDGIVRQQLADVEYERRTGYTYLGPFAAGLLENDYPAWRKRTARPEAVGN